MTSTAPGTLKVLIVDDHAVARHGISAYIDVLEDIVAVGQAVDGQDALEQLAALAVYGGLPDVVLLDLMMPRMDGTTALREIRRKYPEVKVVVLTSFGETERMNMVMQLGASGYLLKDAGAQEVAAAIRAAARDEVFIDTTMARKFTQIMSSPGVGVSSLTERERTVLQLVGTGKSNREIAKELQISERTARTHVSNVLGKLNLSSRTQAALLAVNVGLTAPTF
ncbi:response regulator transcription factor [Arthrobacter sp. zg-Y916]|uniref:Response regulator transcription factor n=1 Tax=Arthrobacter caoxuetaonis TaxID=2886935 RepID=A0A9X1SC97_9MICC|nr:MULTISPECIES: response regulator transcription factor [Arthrobacter]MCC3297461.1 response regulator transcription factor [Arthrobacter caoxuetaonis]MCC9194356.1 response regulator transcription factor [Arthrobacter sp. zg-Y916]USQ58007.1 response regulator transcription factor [Arthrobacter caoxuetaonis]